MQLESLREFDALTAGRVLAAAALSLEPGEMEAAGVNKEYIARVIDEIKSNLKISKGELAVSAKIKIDEALSDALDDILTKGELTAATNTAGREGKLLTGAYDVAFVDTFKTFKALGEREFNVKRMIKSAYERQDIDLETDVSRIDAAASNESPSAISLFTYFWNRISARAHWVVIQTHRVDQKLIVQAVWRLVPGSVDLASATAPLDLLKAFVEKYGTLVNVRGNVGKFVGKVESPTRGYKMASVPDVRNPPWGTDVAHLADNEKFLVFNIQEVVNPVATIFGNAYCVDIADYRGSLVEAFGRRWLSDHD